MTYMPIVTQQLFAWSCASVIFRSFATVEERRMLTVGKDSFNFDITVCVFRELPAFNFPLKEETVLGKGIRKKTSNGLRHVRTAIS